METNPTGLSARQIIKRLMGLTDAQADALMPGGDNNAAGFPGVTFMPGEDDESGWAQREYEKELRQYGDRPAQ